LAATALVRSNELSERTSPAPPREALLMLTLLNHPWLLDQYFEEVAELTLTSPPMEALRKGILELLAAGNPLDSAFVRSHLSAVGLDGAIAAAERAITHKSDKFAAADAEAGDVETGWRHTLAMHQTQVGLRMALQTAEQAWSAEPSEAAWTRIKELQDQLARRSDTEDAGAY
jgi:DNA primase